MYNAAGHGRGVRIRRRSLGGTACALTPRMTKTSETSHASALLMASREGGLKTLQAGVLISFSETVSSRAVAGLTLFRVPSVLSTCVTSWIDMSLRSMYAASSSQSHRLRIHRCSIALSMTLRGRSDESIPVFPNSGHPISSS